MTYVDIIKKWKEKKIDSIEKLDQQLSNFRIIFAYNSGAIENSQITLSCRACRSALQL